MNSDYARGARFNDLNTDLKVALLLLGYSCWINIIFIINYLFNKPYKLNNFNHIILSETGPTG